MKNKLIPMLCVVLAARVSPAAEGVKEPARFQVRLEVVSEGYDGKTCWFHPRAGAIPGEPPTVVLTMQKLNVKRSDVFYPIASLESSDRGRTWSPSSNTRRRWAGVPAAITAKKAFAISPPNGTRPPANSSPPATPWSIRTTCWCSRGPGTRRGRCMTRRRGPGRRGQSWPCRRNRSSRAEAPAARSG